VNYCKKDYKTSSHSSILNYKDTSKFEETIEIEIINSYILSTVNTYLHVAGCTLKLYNYSASEKFFDVCENEMFITELVKVLHLIVSECVRSEDLF
jgi:hypothetical protein